MPSDRTTLQGARIHEAERIPAPCSPVRGHSCSKDSLPGQYLFYYMPILNFETQKKSGKTQGICESDPEGKGFRKFGLCVLCHVSRSCSLTYWL